MRMTLKGLAEHLGVSTDYRIAGSRTEFLLPPAGSPAEISLRELCTPSTALAVDDFLPPLDVQSGLRPVLLG